jgi:molecular chaperone HtpG
VAHAIYLFPLLFSPIERLWYVQALNDPGKYNFMASKKTLEINPYHPIISELAKKIKDAPEDESSKEMAFILYDSCLITAGFDIDDQV